MPTLPAACAILITAGDAGPAGAAEIDAQGVVWRSGPSFWRSETRLVWARVQALDPIGREQARNRGRDGKGALRTAALTAGGAAFGLIGALGGAITAAIWSAAEDIPADRSLVLLRTFDDRFLVFTCPEPALPAVAMWYGRGTAGFHLAGPVIEAAPLAALPPPGSPAAPARLETASLASAASGVARRLAARVTGPKRPKS